MVNQTNKRLIKFNGLFTVRVKPEERKQYEELAETHGFGTLAGLIRACLQAAIRDPTILNPTTDPKLKGVSMKRNVSR